ncbi:MAG: hypothetical protein QOD92_278 [Acidimicrobiaceae bacterium]|jgi:hypothetical protein
MELDWRNRCIGGERLEDLCNVVDDLGATDDEQLFDLLWDDPHTALSFHRALLRVSAELLWQRAGQLAPWRVAFPEEYGSLSSDAFAELLRRAGIEFSRAGVASDRDARSG